MDLKKIQTEVYKNLVEGNNVPLLFRSDLKADASERFSIYQTAYRLRLREALDDDFPVSLQLIDQNIFEGLFNAFVQTQGSPTYTLNELGKYWVHFLTQRQNEVPPWFLDLSLFEWTLAQGVFAVYAADRLQRTWTLQVDPMVEAELDLSAQIIHFNHPVNKIYDSETLLDGKKTSVLFWPQEGEFHFFELEQTLGLIIEAILNLPSFAEFETWLSQSNIPDETQEMWTEKAFRILSERKILKFK